MANILPLIRANRGEFAAWLIIAPVAFGLIPLFLCIFGE